MCELTTRGYTTHCTSEESFDQRARVCVCGVILKKGGGVDLDKEKGTTLRLLACIAAGGEWPRKEVVPQHPEQTNTVEHGKRCPNSSQ